MGHMETKDIIIRIRKENKLSQTAFAEKLFVTRQAVSRWECGKTTPNNETLISISKMFNVSVNELLGDSTTVYCQSCGMPLDASSYSHNPDGKENREYCKWCYHDGDYEYHSMKDLINSVIPFLVKQGFNEKQARSYMEKVAPTLRLWSEKK